jgi:uncharacterized protein YyaL (SSP411 family)
MAGLVDWREWGEAAFEAAADADRPVLLSLTATWCADCHEMDAETYGDPRVAAAVADGFVPVRVDVDRHPRVRERYNAGGFPSTVFLTPSGRVLTAATRLRPEGMRSVLERVRERWAEAGEDAGRVPRALSGDPTPAGEVTPAVEAHLAGQLTEQYDDANAGWGTDAKFPLPRTVEFALKRERELALRTLDAVRDHLCDDVDGGVFRYAGRPDWSDVHREKLLDPNAATCRAFANGYLYTGDDAYRRPAAGIVDFLTDDLWTGAGVGASRGPAADGDYYDRDAEGRAAATTPRRDLTVYAGGNALAADALLTYHAYTDDDRAREYAERILETLERDLLESGVAVHYREGDDVGEACLLGDQARLVGAFATAEQVLGEGVAVAREAADATVERLRTEEGAFRDGPAAGAGLLDRPFRPLDDAVELADALLDLALLTGEERYRDVAADAVGAFAGAFERFGVQVAGYGSVAARLCRESLIVDSPPAGSDLHRAALRVADHEAVVRPGEREVAVVRVGDRTATASSPPDLMAAVADLSE